jgi:hypothetical protein
MESTRRETSYALMDPAFLRQVVNEASTGSGTRAPAGSASRTLLKSWYAGAAGRFLALGRAMAAERR